MEVAIDGKVTISAKFYATGPSLTVVYEVEIKKEDYKKFT